MEREMSFPFEFSVIMAVYNVEPFLKEAVDSLIAQDFGFEKIQLIMVDDGSTDGSGAICDAYAAQYPGNVMVIHKENGGVSSARNTGLQYATGRYYNFMDSDDKLEPNVMSEVHGFFEEHANETDVVAIPLFFFDGQSGQHTLNRKFAKGSRVIDLYREYSMVQLSMASTFVKASSMKGRNFDCRLSFAEDAKLLIHILMDKGAIGAVSTAKYCYRKRTTGERSAIQQSQQVYNWYLPYIQFFQESIIQYCEESLGYVPKFVQYTLAYDLQWRFKQKSIPSGILTEQEEVTYKEKLKGILQYLDDSIILEQKSVWQEHKLFALMKKHSEKPAIVKRKDDMFLRFGNTNCYYISNCQFTIEFMTMKSDSCKIEGYTVLFPIELNEFCIYAEVNGELYKCRERFRHETETALGHPILNYYGFDCEIPLNKVVRAYNIRFFISIDDYLIEKRNVVFKGYTPIDPSYEHSYYAKCGWRLMVQKNRISISAVNALGCLKLEVAFLHELWSKNRTGNRKAVFARSLAKVFRMFKRKQIWLLSDKANRADDNGEAFFLYLRDKKPKNIVPYFLIEKSSSDYQKLGQYGRVVPYMSWKHKLLYLVADYTISAYSHDEINNPFRGYDGPYRDLLQECKYVFLQHGVTKDDVSAGTNKYHKNIKMFVCSAQDEYESILQTPTYGYTKKEIALVGLPRYDRLYHAEKNAIVIMPTWRRDLFGDYHPKDSRWDLKPGFKESAYYKFYEGLLNNKKLLGAADRLGYEINFVPHPIFFPYIDNFSIPNEVKMRGTDVVYRDMFAQNKLLVTDFSSVAFDFAYLRKPVLYVHFDTNHYQEGYFDYERDGFGEVVYNLEDTVNKMIEYMTNECKLKEEYRVRIDNFFAFNDRNNCQRVYERILELNEWE